MDTIVQKSAVACTTSAADKIRSVLNGASSTIDENMAAILGIKHRNLTYIQWSLGVSLHFGY